MDKVKLTAKIRNVFGKKTKKGKKEGLIPAIVYGKKVAPKSLWIKKFDFLKLLKEVGESTMIELNIGGKDKKNVVIYETQKDPLTDNFIHVDFFQVRMDEEIETEVELSYIGEALAVKELGGVLVKNLDEITVRCLPSDLPSEIKVDISSLNTFEDHITIKDLKISSKVKIEIDPETVVALVAPPRSEEELEELSEKVEEDVTKVEGVDEEKSAEESEDDKEEGKKEEMKEDKKEEK